MKKLNLSDTEIACNIIKSNREYGRRTRTCHEELLNIIRRNKDRDEWGRNKLKERRIRTPIECFRCRTVLLASSEDIKKDIFGPYYLVCPNCGIRMDDECKKR